MNKQPEMSDNLYVAFIEHQGRYWLMTGRDKTISCASTEDEAKEWFEGAYKRAHRRNYESSMSATLMWISLQPSIVRTTGDVITQLINFPTTPYQIGGVAGRIHAFKFDDQERAKELFDAGIRPALIKDEWL